MFLFNAGKYLEELKNIVLIFMNLAIDVWEIIVWILIL
jgi:hypothetical protein